MSNLYKSNMRRLSRNPLFIGGLALAFLATLAFTSNMIGMTGRFAAIDNEKRMFFISIAMMGFFTVFVPVFSNVEYGNGVIRNKIVAGYSIKQVFYSHLLTHISALFLMSVVYMIAGILGGARISGAMLLKNAVLFFALCAYISVLMLLAIRVKRIVVLIGYTFLILMFSYSVVMIGNALLSFVLKGSAKTFGTIIYNMIAFGQWFSNTWIGVDEINPGNIAQLAISTGMILIQMLLGTFRLNRRDLK